MSTFVKFAPWLMSAITIWMTVLAGNKHSSAWLIGLGNQALWLAWIVASANWGLLPMNFALWIVYGRNHLKWSGRTAYRPWENCQDAPWPKASRLCDDAGRIVGKTHGDHTGHWAFWRGENLGEYTTEAEAQAAVDRKARR